MVLPIPILPLMRGITGEQTENAISGKVVMKPIKPFETFKSEWINPANGPMDVMGALREKLIPMMESSSSFLFAALVCVELRSFIYF
jgi:hypothetical protein